MPNTVWIYLLCINIAAFLVTAADKRFAKRQKRRVRERTLILLAAAGGALGTFLAMELCRHKTKKPLFYIGVPLLLFLWVAILVLVNK
ncbi:MAG: DUF1294 domain-containing protein [Clostridia bacterium]|nr:DUF1294 domain-containing protein [Clostridia bacterium]